MSSLSAADHAILAAVLARCRTVPDFDDLRALITAEALRRSHGSITQAARLLGISRQALYLRKRTGRVENEHCQGHLTMSGPTKSL